MTSIPPEAIEAAKQRVAWHSESHPDGCDLHECMFARALLDAKKELSDTVALANKNFAEWSRQFEERAVRAEKAEAELAAQRESAKRDRDFAAEAIARITKGHGDLRAKVAAAVEEFHETVHEHHPSVDDFLDAILARHGLTEAP